MLSSKVPAFLKKDSNLSRGINISLNHLRFICELNHVKNRELQPVAASVSASSSGEHPKLVKIRTLPLAGTQICSYSGTPKLEYDKMYEYHPEMRRRFGSFFTHGVPVLGKGLHGTIYNICDPDEMLKIIRSEGKYPSGIVENLWALKKLMKDKKSALVNEEGNHGLFGRGELWKKHRTFLQTGMLSPHASRGYIPGIVSAAELACKGAISNKHDILFYLHRCSFDMFCTFMFGELTQCAANNNTDSNMKNIEFCKAACKLLELNFTLTRSLRELILSTIGYRTQLYKEMERNWNIVMNVAMKKTHDFYARYHKNKDLLSPSEKKSYLANAIERQALSQEVTKEEMFELCQIGLFAAIDTTTSVISWNLVHLALNQSVQEKLYEELSQAVITSGGLNETFFNKSTTPYLHAVIRETHRVTPPLPTLLKRNSQSDVNIHGITIPKDSVFNLQHIGIDPKYCPHYTKTFLPERWLQDAVRQRKGTDQQVIDHALFRDPFSAGARRCPGSRVATYEILIFISKMVLEYKIVPRNNGDGEWKELKDVEYFFKSLIMPKEMKLDFIPRE